MTQNQHLCEEKAQRRLPLPPCRAADRRTSRALSEPPQLPVLSCQHLKDYLRTWEGAESTTGSGLGDPWGGVLWRATASVAAAWGHTVNLLVMPLSDLFWQWKTRKVRGFFSPPPNCSHSSGSDKTVIGGQHKASLLVSHQEPHVILDLVCGTKAKIKLIVSPRLII